MYFFLVSARNLRTVLELFMCTTKFLLSYRLHTSFWQVSVMIMHSQSFLRSSIISRRCSLIFSSYPFIDNFLPVSIFLSLYSTYLPSKASPIFLFFFLFWFIVCGCVIIQFWQFWFKKPHKSLFGISYRFFWEDSGTCLINQS